MSKARKGTGGSVEDLMDRTYLDAMSIRHASLTDKVRLPSEAGFAGPRVRMEDLAGSDGVRRMGATLAAAGLRLPGLVCGPDAHDWHTTRLDEDPVIAAVQRDLDAAAELGSPVLVLPVMSTIDSVEVLHTNLTRLVPRAEALGVTIGLEFIGHVPKLPDVASAWNVVRRLPSVIGLVVDCFHFHRGGSRLRDLEQVPASRVAMVDLCDAMDLPASELLGYRHRLLPGDGVAPVAEVVCTLLQAGYGGAFAVELFNEAYWSLPPADFAAQAGRAVSRFYAQRVV